MGSKFILFPLGILGRGRYTKQVSNLNRIPAYQQSVLTGLILSEEVLVQTLVNLLD
jgi:hypothetical protein